jgi:hypothetical protein
VWRESNRDKKGQYDLRHYVWPIDPALVQTLENPAHLRSLIRARKSDLKPDEIVTEGAYEAVSSRIVAWEKSMMGNQFTLATLGEPRIFSHHPDPDDPYDGGGNIEMIQRGWLAVAR